MELRDFAEHILFAKSLEEKLRPPPTLTDENPCPALMAPTAPGRPAELTFKVKGIGKGEFPGRHRLEKPEERGKLLHFFANHELLAVELMALVLLRFPDAPPAFRRGVLQTLKDEQEHTRLYLNRMRQCGIEFGEMPVSGYFWRALSGMENPMQYVAGLSLTFEQANLDFARQFAADFTAIGDRDSATLLERIYRDEIGHVAYGLKWFRRWKNPQASDWEAFCRELKFPLSPQRAKGTVLNAEGRLAAGFDESFVAELSVYSQSKGRTPTIFLFNPFAEEFIALGKAFTPASHQLALANDLENLPQFLCRTDDIVLLRKRPALAFLQGLQQAGFGLPEFVELTGPRADGLPAALLQRKLGGLRPWAWGPDSLGVLGPLFPNLSGSVATAQTRDQVFNPAIARLYSKGWSAAFLRKILPATSSWLCGVDDAGREVDTLEEALAVIAELRGQGRHKLVAKQSLGVAGHNAIRLWEPDLLETQKRWIERSFAQGRTLVIEPWLDRRFDFSIQLEMEPRGLRLLGFTTLLVDSRGQYQGNRAASNFSRNLPIEIAGLFPEHKGIARIIQELYATIISGLGLEFAKAGYLGPVGIDAFVYADGQGECRLKPIVEINPRYTMGRVTLELMKHVYPGSSGLFRLVNLREVKREGHTSFSEYAKTLTAQNPLLMDGAPVSKIREGLICLNDPNAAKACLAIFQVSAGRHPNPQ